LCVAFCVLGAVQKSELLTGWYLILLCGSSAGLPINLDVENSLIRLRSARNELIEDRLSAAMQAAENRSDGTTSTNFDCRVPVFISGLKRSFLCDLEELGLTAALLLRACNCWIVSVVLAYVGASVETTQIGLEVHI
jgi:hypothetical protein